MEGGVPKVIRIYQPTYRTEPEDNARFYPSEVKNACEAVLKSNCDSMMADDASFLEEAPDRCAGMVEQIKAKVKELNIPRYKIVVQVTLGENKGQGVRVASRCLWDHKTDNYATLTYKNERYFACAVVFGAYTE